VSQDSSARRSPSPIQVEHDKLRQDVVAVRQYGEAHPEAWVELRIENEPTVRIVALFAGDDVRRHEQTLHRLVAYPDQLEVHSSPWPLIYLEEIRAHVHQIGRTREPGVLQGDGITYGRLDVRLAAGQEELATQLHDRYGDAIDLTVGFFHFPDMAVLNNDGLPKQRTKPERPPLLPSDEIQVSIPEGLEVRSGYTCASVLQMHNRRSDEVRVMTNGQLTAYIVDPATQEMVGGFSGAQRMPSVGFRILPGDTTDIPLLIASASAVPRLGYAIPPGHWAIETQLRLGDWGLFRTPPLSINVVP
jgi:hypothetical protein